MMSNNKIELTKEQKSCVEWPLNNNLVIEANPGTGKTEVLKYRTLFIHQQNERQRKLILVLAYGRNIAAEIRTKLKAEKLRVYDRLKNILPALAHQHTCSLNECPVYLESTKPLILVCTIHSLANGINDLVIKKQFQEKRRTKILVATQDVEKKHGLVPLEDKNQKFIWKSRGSIKSRKKRLFNYLLSQIEEKYLDQTKRKILWGIFQQSEPENVILNKVSDPYFHYNIDYSRFLTQIWLFLPKDKKLLTKLEESCRQDQEKNVWLDFDDIIANANNFTALKKKKIWPEFDYILVDECQDLKIETFKLITEIFGSNQTNFTFVGDPKQNIMAFAGARENVFSLLEQKFPQQTNGIIATSFRLPQEIADFANDFIARFMSHRTSIKTIKSNNNHKPQIIIAGQEKDYQLNQNEEATIEEEVRNNPEIKKANLIQSKIRRKKLYKHLEAILPIINNLDENNSKAILYRQNWIGNLLQEWLNKKCIITNISEAIINDIIRKVRRNLNYSLNEFSSLKDFLVSLKIAKNSIFQLTEIVQEIDENFATSPFLTKDKINNFIRQLEEIKNHHGIILSTIHGMKGLEADHVFLIFCDKKILPKKEKFTSKWETREEQNLFFTAITRPKTGLYITTSSWKECSEFIEPSNLDLNLVELITPKTFKNGKIDAKPIFEETK
ncbi:UvrD-helicase domain-containing protein [endosymbiont GvMRE of Glomus versiforme]|uniref:UvrD-helicase domain-containing protein n=1 Tax=endosymbiont GvMRE of Glomus versiforme TaxID=2039283 RepID=UPI000EDCF14C|nr:ATP-dependent helicase [endosymbiont GvMRE of Glomus versiforme]RHZ36595.1 DNA helicase [endosymbiont GvMRE of Glomus versiforme]